jgi:hypothetical protein
VTTTEKLVEAFAELQDAQREWVEVERKLRDLLGNADAEIVIAHVDDEIDRKQTGDNLHGYLRRHYGSEYARGVRVLGRNQFEEKAADWRKGLN